MNHIISMGGPVRTESFFFVFFKLDSVNGNASVLCVPIHAFHTVITDFLRVKIAAVAFATAYAFTVIQYA